MHRIDHPTADTTDPLKPVYTEGNPTLGVPATVVTAPWLNDVQENIIKVLDEAGITPTKGRDADLLDAILNIASANNGLRASDVLTYNTTTALTSLVLGGTVIYNGAGAAAFTLPVINTPAGNCPEGTRIEILNQGTGALTITRGGSDTFRYNGGGTATTIATLPPGGNATLESDGISNWHLVGGTLALQYGDHVGKTQAQFDDSTLLATTGFVQRAIGNRRGYLGVTTNTSLTAAHAGMNIYASSSTGAITLSLPAANAMPAGASFRIMNTGLDPVNISRVGADTIVTHTTSDTVTAITLLTGEWVEICSLGTGTLWYNAGGSQQIRNDRVLQSAYTANASLTTALPIDDTTPLVTEGTEICSQSITPSNASRKIRVSFNGFGASSAPNTVIAVAIFRGSTCIAATAFTTAGGGSVISTAVEVLDAPASASPVVYSVRVGSSGGTALRMNGTSSGRLFGGSASSNLILEEV